MHRIREMEASVDTRIEHDSLGELAVPADRYYGVQTVRALANFPISGIPISSFPALVRALGAIKKAAALANAELGLLAPDVAQAIVQACGEVMEGRHDQDFVVDAIQGGAGTSTNMNANEVIANRALELLGRPRGAYADCHPNNHVNLSQSTNDVYPTAVKIATIWKIAGLKEAMRDLQAAFRTKSTAFAGVLKLGRTQLQDAIPMTLGQEFGAWAVTVGEDIERLGEAALLIHEINLGATAIGTGLNTVEGYAECARRHLAEITELPLVTAFDLVEATSDPGAFVQLSGVLKRIAVKASKIASDLRLLSSGPLGGLGEIQLPAVQPGSTIMPGKVNPVIPEMVNQVCFQVIGNDVTITMAAEGGQLQLNAFEPIIAFNLFQSIQILTRAFTVLRERCVEDIQANEAHCRDLLERSTGLVTALVPFVGYEAAAALAHEALATGRRIRELAQERGVLDGETLDRVLDPATMTRPGRA